MSVEYKKIEKFISSLAKDRFYKTESTIKIMQNKMKEVVENRSKLLISTSIYSCFILMNDLSNAKKYAIMSILISHKDPIYIDTLGNYYLYFEKNYKKSYLISKIALSKANKDGNFIRQMAFSHLRSLLRLKMFSDIISLLDHLREFKPTTGSIDVRFEVDFLPEMREIPELREACERYEAVVLRAIKSE